VLGGGGVADVDRPRPCYVLRCTREEEKDVGCCERPTGPHKDKVGPREWEREWRMGMEDGTWS